MQKRFSRIFTALFTFLMLSAFAAPAFANAAEETNTDLITTREALVAAIDNAEDGDTILVGDVNFGDMAILPNNKIIRKSITVKNGKTDGTKAFFKNASLTGNGESSGITLMTAPYFCAKKIMLPTILPPISR